MAVTFCPACGLEIKNDLQFCPACGTKISVAKREKSQIDKELENAIAQAETYATSVLYTKSQIIFKELNNAELKFLAIIDNFPTKAESYIAYVRFMVAYIERIVNPQRGDNTVYLKDYDGTIAKMKSFLQSALKYADNDTDGKLLQEISELQQKTEALTLDKSLAQKNAKTKKMAKIGACFVIAILVIYLIVKLL